MPASNPARVAYVVKRYPRFSETFIVNEILAHEAAGVAVEIFSLYPPNDTHFQDLLARVRAPVTYLPAEGLRAADLWSVLTATGAQLPRFWSSLGAAAGSDARVAMQATWLARLLVERKIDHLHAHFATVAAEVGGLAAQWSGVPCTVTAHAKDIFHESVTVAGLRRILGRADRVITVSEFNRAHLTRVVGLREARVQRIYNGLDLARFSYHDPAERRPEIVSVGRLVEKKGFGDLLRACALLRDRGVPFGCRIIGTGPEEDRLRRQAAELSLTSRVRFDGALPQPAVIAALEGCAVFAAPCVVAGDGDRDGLPTVLLESMALGTPVVSTDVVGIPEIVRNGDTGCLVPQRAPDALADALAGLLHDRARRVLLSRAARTLIEHEFDVARNAAALRGVFAESQLRPLARAS